MKTVTEIIAVVAVALLLVGVVYAVTVLTSGHISGTPQPTPSPTPTPTATPTANPNPTTLTLTRNGTTVHIGDIITLTATLDKPVSGIAVTFYNLSIPIAVTSTDSSGAATYVTSPQTVAYDYYATATIP